MKDFSERLDSLTGRIKTVEQELRETAHFAEADFEWLSWCQDGGRMWRIFVGDKPLQEATVDKRIGAVSLLDGLIAAADVAMERLLTSGQKVVSAPKKQKRILGDNEEN